MSLVERKANTLLKFYEKPLGELITVTNGKGLEWNGKLLLVTPSKTTAKLLDATQHKCIQKIKSILQMLQQKTTTEWNGCLKN